MGANKCKSCFDNKIIVDDFSCKTPHVISSQIGYTESPLAFQLAFSEAIDLNLSNLIINISNITPNKYHYE
jgi:hypothetical protein